MSKIFRSFFVLMLLSILVIGCSSNEVPPATPSVESTEEPKPLPSEEVKTEVPALEDTWWKTYGGSADDEVFDILLAKDGGLYLLGATNVQYDTERHADLYLIRIDSEGEVLWERTYSSDVVGQSITFTADGNLLIAGVTLSGDTGFDPYLLKIDLEGNELWSKTLSGPLDEWGHTIQPTFDGGFILFCNSVDPNDIVADPEAAGYGGFEGRSNILLIKTNEMGEEVWRRVYKSKDNILSTSGVQTPDGGYAVAASILYFPEPGDHQLLMKVDENGEEVWSRTWEEGRTNARDLILTSDGEFLIITLFSASGDPREGDADLIISKLDQDGEEIWSTLHGEPEMVELGSALTEASDGSYMIVGVRTRDLRRSPSDMILVKVSKEGQVIWEKTVISAPHFMIHGVAEHKDGGYLLAAAVQRGYAFDILVVKTDAQGEVSE
jgi:hypothetical protein